TYYEGGLIKTSAVEVQDGGTTEAPSTRTALAAGPEMRRCNMKTGNLEGYHSTVVSKIRPLSYRAIVSSNPST
ncbi:unnamed protein product, partial [marine sediment metagenome]